MQTNQLIILLKQVNIGIPGKNKTIYSVDRILTGSIAPMSLNDYTRRYQAGVYLNDGNYSLSTTEVLKIGAVIEYNSQKLKVIGFTEGRIRHHARLQVMSNE